MRFILALIICAAAPFRLYDDISKWIAMTPSRLFPAFRYTGPRINDDVLSIPLSEDLKLNEQSDTVYVNEITTTGRLPTIEVWKNNNPNIFIYGESSILVYHKKNRPEAYYILLKSWEPDMLRHIGNEVGRNILPLSTDHVARIIFYQGATTIDTVSFLYLDEIKYTKHQLDSIREVVRLKKLSEKMDSAKADKDTVPTYTQTNDNSTKNFASSDQPKESLSLWEQFIAWLRRLWEAIFG